MLRARLVRVSVVAVPPAAKRPQLSARGPPPVERPPPDERGNAHSQSQSIGTERGFLNAASRTPPLSDHDASFARVSAVCTPLPPPSLPNLPPPCLALSPGASEMSTCFSLLDGCDGGEPSRGVVSGVSPARGGGSVASVGKFGGRLQGGGNGWTKLKRREECEPDVK